MQPEGPLLLPPPPNHQAGPRSPSSMQSCIESLRLCAVRKVVRTSLSQRWGPGVRINQGDGDKRGRTGKPSRNHMQRRGRWPDRERLALTGLALCGLLQPGDKGLAGDNKGCLRTTHMFFLLGAEIKIHDKGRANSRDRELGDQRT